MSARLGAMRLVMLGAGLVAVLAPGVGSATAQEPSGPLPVDWTAPVRWELGGGFLVAGPVGEFADFVGGATGFGLFGTRYFGNARKLGIRVDLTLVAYGRTTASHTLALSGTSFDLDVITENGIGGFAIGPQYIMGRGVVRPYVNASVGSAQFITTSSAWADGRQVPIGTGEILERHVTALAAGGGVRLALWSRRSHPIALEIDGRYVHHGSVEYLREGGVRELPDGSLALDTIVSDANLWRIHVAAVFGFR